MKVPIRTLTSKDAEIMARASVTAKVSKGYVERHGLRWTSNALKEWELRQKNLGRPCDVEVLIDELNLAAVYVVLPAEDGNSPLTLRALSSQPMYTQDLSLYEHEKMKVALKQENLECRLMQMEDSLLYDLRLEYYALLGRQDDPISARRLEKIRDQLAARGLADATSRAEQNTEPAPDCRNDSASPLPEVEATVVADPTPAVQKKVRKNRDKPFEPHPTKSADFSPAQEATDPIAPNPAGPSPASALAVPPSTPRGVKTKPTYPSMHIKRIPK